MIVTRLYELETEFSETICLDILIAKRNRCIAFVYWPPYNKKIPLSSRKLTVSWIKENIIIAKDVKVDISVKEQDLSNYLSELYHTFSMKNYIFGKNFWQSATGTSAYVMLI